MELKNDLTHDAITDIDVTVYLYSGGDDVSSCKDCRTIVLDGVLSIDFIPRFNGKYSAPVPDDAIVSKTNNGKVGVFITHHSEAGHLLRQLWDQRKLVAYKRN